MCDGAFASSPRLTGRGGGAKLPGMQTDRARADARLEAALDRAGVEDPRPFFRERLRLLKERNPRVYEEARRHFETEVLPRVAMEDSDPIAEWIEYGRRLGEWTAPGKTYAIDATGRARTYAPPLDPGHLVLHIPDDTHEPALILSMPRAPSLPQQATCDLLVRGRLARSGDRDR